MIDDYVPNVKSFIDGGKHRMAVLFSQPWNSQQGQQNEIEELERRGTIIVKKSWKEIELLF
jgi:hypothetical protein